jgi:hypothetical protein
MDQHAVLLGPPPFQSGTATMHARHRFRLDDDSLVVSVVMAMSEPGGTWKGSGRAPPRHEEEHLLGPNRAGGWPPERGQPPALSGTVHVVASSTSGPRMMLVDDVDPGGEEGGDGAVVGEARLAAGVPHLLHPLAAPQDAVAPATVFFLVRYSWLGNTVVVID